MLLSFIVGRIAIDHIKALSANVSDQPLHLLTMIVAFYQSQIEDGSSSFGNDVASQRAHVAAADAVDVQRWFIDQFQQTLTPAFRARQTELRTQLVVIGLGLRARPPLFFAQRFDAVRPTRDRYSSRIV